MSEQKTVERNIPGMNQRNGRFAQVEYAENVGATLKRIWAYFVREKIMVISMLGIVILGTLCGIYAPSLQSINNQNIKDVSRDSLRKNVAIVLQDTVLFSDTIRNNLKYSNENSTEEQLQKALEMSRCKEMIQMLPKGCDTVLTGSAPAFGNCQSICCGS